MNEPEFPALRFDQVWVMLSVHGDFSELISWREIKNTSIKPKTRSDCLSKKHTHP